MTFLLVWAHFHPITISKPPLSPQLDCCVDYVKLSPLKDIDYIWTSTIELRSGFVRAIHTFRALKHGMTRGSLFTDSPRILCIT